MNELRPGEGARVRAIPPGAAHRRLRELGLVEGAAVRCVGRSPLGDPAAYAVCGAVLALRDALTRNIIVEG